MRRGQYDGPEPLRLAVLKYAAVLGAPYVDVEYLAANFFFASEYMQKLNVAFSICIHAEIPDHRGPGHPQCTSHRFTVHAPLCCLSVMLDI